MSRAVPKRVDAENIPIRAQQIVVPILAVGLAMARERGCEPHCKVHPMFVSMRSAPDDAIRAAFCHHCENYIALMEYYAPRALHGSHHSHLKTENSRADRCRSRKTPAAFYA
ncbi:MAG: hypothetical protein ACLSGP_09540 [Faecalibacterium prausnitzii]